jgi:hypothetical protein
MILENNNSCVRDSPENAQSIVAINDVTMVLESCHNRVTIVLQCIMMVSQWCFDIVTKVLQWCDINIQWCGG